PIAHHYVYIRKYGRFKQLHMINTRPVNKLAAIVVSSVSAPQREFTRTHKVTSMSPIPTKMWHGLPKHDLTGVVFGRFTVIGPLATMKKYSTGCRWVV